MKTQYKPGTVEHNIDVAFRFTRLVLENPELLEEIPNGATVAPLPADDPRQFEESLQMGIHAARNGYNVYMMHIPTLPEASK